MILTRKIGIFPVGNKEEIDRVYTYLRNGIVNQNKAMNQYISSLYIAAIKDASKEDRKELNNLYARISSSKKGSAYSHDISLPIGLPVTASITTKVKKDFAKQCKNGLLSGKESLITYKIDNPLLVHVDYIRLRKTNPHRDNGIYHNYKSHQEFLDHLYEKDLEIFIKFSNNITFKIVFGNPHKSAALRNEFQKIFEEKYKICGSSIQIEGTKIILNLSIDIPEKKIELKEDVVVGVDLGMAVSAMCALNNDIYECQAIGNYNDFIRVKTKIQSQRKRLQKSLKNTSGGHGRTKKLKALNRIKKSERHFIETYSHMVSRKVVEFAIKNHAKYINLESISAQNIDKFVLNSWNYNRLQQYITYKAKMYGIETRKVNPCFTSQVCSICGNWSKDQRKSQFLFECANKECESHVKYEHGFNADFNAARNIAKSTLFIKDGKITENDIIAAKKHYGIKD